MAFDQLPLGNHRRLFILFLPFILFSNQFDQSILIDGTVQDSLTGKHLPNVNIFLDQDKAFGTTTDKDGYFELLISRNHQKSLIIFEHIGYDSLMLSVKNAQNKKSFLLIPLIIDTEPIRVQEKRYMPEILSEAKMPVTIIEKKRFETQAYIDLGDLLKTDQSIRIEEELSGKKTISLHAGNADDVVVLYNGIKMNSNFDNTSDLSFVDLSNVEAVEIIRGSNTALYGSGAFSGIVNVIPKTEYDFSVRFQQKFGTYNTGEWNLQLNRQLFDRLNITYSLKEGASKRKYAESVSKSDFIKNELRHHQVGLLYFFDGKDYPQNSLNINYLNQLTEYDNYRNGEQQKNLNEIYSVIYDGQILSVNDFKLTASYNRLNTEQVLGHPEGKMNRGFFNDNYALKIEKKLAYNDLDFIFAYQYQDNNLDYNDEKYKLYDNGIPSRYPPDLLSSDFHQGMNGLVAISHFHAESGSEFFNPLDIGLSYRYDNVQNSRKNFHVDENNQPSGGDQKWEQSTVKFSSSLSGGNDQFDFDSYCNFGTNVKFPSISEQISTPQSILGDFYADPTPLKPETAKALEIGGSLTRQVPHIQSLDNIQMDLTYFKNFYSNKIVTFQSANSPLAFTSNVGSAVISGFDLKAAVSLFNEKLKLESGSSFYDISDILAFPFKYKSKTIFNIFYNIWGFNTQFHWFKEGKQTGMVKTNSGRFEMINLPRHSNIDIHLSHTFEFMQIKFFSNLSIRNLLDDITTIEGIAIHDRRIYLTFGLKY